MTTGQMILLLTAVAYAIGAGLAIPSMKDCHGLKLPLWGHVLWPLYLVVKTIESMWASLPSLPKGCKHGLLAPVAMTPAKCECGAVLKGKHCTRCGRVDGRGQPPAPKEGTFKPIVTPAPPPRRWSGSAFPRSGDTVKLNTPPAPPLPPDSREGDAIIYTGGQWQRVKMANMAIEHTSRGSTPVRFEGFVVPEMTKTWPVE